MAVEMNRRSFVASVAGVGALTALGLAGCSPTKESTSSTEAAQATSETQEASQTSYLEQTDYSISETKDFDVVVVGAGGAGMSAATRSAELGMNTVILEQHSATGGTTLPSDSRRSISKEFF